MAVMSDASDAEKYLLESIRLALENVRLRRGQPFGAVLVRDGAVLATGVNQVEAHNDPTAHAEVQALRNAGRTLGHADLRGAIVYASGYPCAMCLAAMAQAGVERVWFAYSNEDCAPYGLSAAPSYERLGCAAGDGALRPQGLRVRLPGEDVFEVWRQLKDKAA